VSEQLAQGCYPMEYWHDRVSNLGPLARIPSALTTKPLNHLRDAANEQQVHQPIICVLFLTKRLDRASSSSVSDNTFRLSQSKVPCTKGDAALLANEC